MPSLALDSGLCLSLLQALEAKLLKELQQMSNELADLQAAGAAMHATVAALQAKVNAAVQMIADLRKAVSQPGIDPAAVAAVTAVLSGDNAAVVTGEAALDAAVVVPTLAPAAPAA